MNERCDGVVVVVNDAVNGRAGRCRYGGSRTLTLDAHSTSRHRKMSVRLCELLFPSRNQTFSFFSSHWFQSYNQRQKQGIRCRQQRNSGPRRVSWDILASVGFWKRGHHIWQGVGPWLGTLFFFLPALPERRRIGRWNPSSSLASLAGDAKLKKAGGSAMIILLYRGVRCPAENVEHLCSPGCVCDRGT